MDKVELRIRLNQMAELKDDGEFEEAANIADEIAWRRVKSYMDLSLAADVYEAAGRFEDAYQICVFAYNRELGGKRVVYRLTELALKINNLPEAEDLYQEFVETYPKDNSKYVLLYKIKAVQGTDINELIDILNEYKKNELEEEYEYELALLYAKAGRTEECIQECDELILWFDEGEYVRKALLLKQQFTELTAEQEQKLEIMQDESLTFDEDLGLDEINETESQYTDEKDADYVAYTNDILDFDVSMQEMSATAVSEFATTAVVNTDVTDYVGMMGTSKETEDEDFFDELARKIAKEVEEDLNETATMAKFYESPEEEYVSVNPDDDVSEEDIETTEEYEEESAEITEEYEEEQIEITEEYEEESAEITEEYEEEQIEITEEYEEDHAETTEEYVEEHEEGHTEETEDAETDGEMFDEGESEDDSETSLRLSESEKKYLRRYLGNEKMETALAQVINDKKNLEHDGTSSNGNLVIVGKNNADKVGLAINIIKAIHANSDCKQLKMARTTATTLNKKKELGDFVDKIKGNTFVIENAGMLYSEVVKELVSFMTGSTDSSFIILTGEEYSINRLFREHPTFAKMFSYSIEMKNMSVNDLVLVAKGYAEEKGYIIEEKAVLKLYLLIDGLQTTLKGNECEEVKKLVDEAIERCDNDSKWPFKRKVKGLIVLKEKHFK